MIAWIMYIHLKAKLVQNQGGVPCGSDSGPGIRNLPRRIFLEPLMVESCDLLTVILVWF